MTQLKYVASGLWPDVEGGRLAARKKFRYCHRSGGAFFAGRDARRLQPGEWRGTVQEVVLSGEVKLRKPGQIFQNGVGVNQGKPFRNRNRSYAAVNRIAMFPVPTTGNFSSLNRERRNPVTL